MSNLGMMQSLMAANTGVAGLPGLILADSPSFYYRHDEPSGTTLVGTVGANGTYVSPTLNQPALYAGGPTSVFFPGSGNYALIPASVMPAGTVPAISLVTIFRTNSVTGTIQLLTRDSSGGARIWQFRILGSNLEWVKITGAVETVSRAHGMVANTVYMLGVDVSATGVVKLYVNGIQLGTDGAVTAVNYGDATREIAINNRVGLSEGRNSSFSESCGFNHVLGPARHAQYAAAAGL